MHFRLFWTILKFLQKSTIHYYSSDEKRQGEIAKPVWPIVLEIVPRSVQEGGPQP